MFFLVQADGRDLGRAEGTLYKQLDVRRIVDDVDILVAKLADNTMNTATLHTDTGTYRVDAVIVALNSNLCTLTGDAGNLLNGNQSVIDFGNFHFEQALQEHRRRTAQDNLRIIVLVVHTCHYGAGSLTLAVEVARYLFGLGQQQLVAFIIEQQHFFLPYLVDFCVDDASHLINIFVIDTIFFQFQNLGGQCLTQIQDGTAAELGKVHFVRHFLARLIRSIYLLCFT